MAHVDVRFQDLKVRFTDSNNIDKNILVCKVDTEIIDFIKPYISSETGLVTLYCISKVFLLNLTTIELIKALVTQFWKEPGAS